MNLKRDDILSKAIHDCYIEMYAKAQPPADYDNLVEEYNSGKIGKDERIYERHYLSMDEFIYIRDKYVQAYRMTKLWDEDIEILEDYLKNGGSKDKYIPKRTDENGFVHSGYKGYEKVPPLIEQIFTCLYEYTEEHEAQDIAERINKIVMDTISDCKNFYKFDREESDFGIAVALGASPTCNPETVKKWWKENYDVDVEIEERNPLLFWEQDEYGDDFEEIMENEYGENWKEYWDNRWKKEKEEKAKEKEEVIKKLIAEQAENEPPVETIH